MKTQKCTLSAITGNAKNNVKKLFSLIAGVLLILSSVAVHAQDKLVGLASNGGPDGKGTAFSIKTDASGFSVIKSFIDWGSFPTGDLVRGTDGYFYGMVPEGGTFGNGTIFKMSSGGSVTILRQLELYADGGYPKGSLLQANDGNFYGLLSAGSVNNGGAIFKITPAGDYTIVRSLNFNNDGGRPLGHLIQAKDGNFYGLNSSGGLYGYGNIFKITPAGQYTVLKSFNTTDGQRPSGSLLEATDGNFYGMTSGGGANNTGVIFRYAPAAAAYSVLYNYSANGADGQYPNSDLIQAKDGYLYGMTPGGGANYSGTIFKINMAGTSFTLIKSLSAGAEGANAKGRLLQAADGSFYALAFSISGSFAGSVFKMTTAGATTAIKKFTLDTDGGYPVGSLIQSTDGLLYGMTNSGGRNGNGTIFKMTTGGAMTVLSSLNGATQGNTPQDNLALGKDSAYYGVTRYGGTYNYGTIFKICGGSTTVLRSFNRNTDGGNPTGGLVRGIDGNFYGMTETGGTYSAGTIYRITPLGSFAVLRQLNGPTDGYSPKGTLVQGADSALYGITNSGGSGSGGTIFKIKTTGSFTVLHNLVSSTEGNSSETGLVLAGDGFFYGMTGTNTHFFKISKDGAFTSVKALSYSTDGNNPGGNMIQGSDGNLYGTLSGGGNYGYGVIFKIATNGTLTKLRHLNGTTDGGTPKGGLVLATDGNFYGTNSVGGTNKAGTIFRITPAGTYSVLRNLNLTKDGGAPLGGLILAPKNTLAANPQSNLPMKEDSAKAIVLTGSGGQGLAFNVVTAPRHGTLSSGTSANRIYTPKPNYSGKDSFAFTVNIGCMASAPAWVTFTVKAVNDAPVLQAIGNKSIIKDSVFTFTAQATDIDGGQTKTYTLINPPAGAAINPATGVFTWTPAATGIYSFTVRVTDNGSPVLYDEELVTDTVVNSPAPFAPVSISSYKHEEQTIKTTIYPNPVVNILNIAVHQPAKLTLRIIDMKASVLYNKSYEAGNRQHLAIDVNAYRAGQYLLQVQTEKGTEVLKWIKL